MRTEGAARRGCTWLLAAIWLALAGVLPAAAHATNYSLWINGRGAGGAPGNYNDFAYWGPAGVAAGVNKKAVNWDGAGSIASASGRLRDALDCFCTGPNWCYVAAYSAGDLLMGYTLANYGGSSRGVRNAVPNGAGVCGVAGGSQTGWNIKWVRVAAGAAGGSELADAGAWTTSEPLVRDLRTSTARAMAARPATITTTPAASGSTCTPARAAPPIPFSCPARTTKWWPITAVGPCPAMPAVPTAIRATGSVMT